MPNVRHYYSSFRIGRVYSSFKRDAGLTPNAPMSGAGARSAEASAQLAGWAAAVLLFELSELPLRLDREDSRVFYCFEP